MTKRKPKYHVKSVPTFDEFFKKLQEYEGSLLASTFYKKLCEDLKHCCDELQVVNVKQIICYGLGRISECLIAKYQLALLHLLKSHLKSEVWIYDPIFSNLEIEFLTNLHLSVIDHNEEGARDVDCVSLIYLPHCPTGLVNNLLWHNWSPKISNCIILGNSFESLVCNETKRKFEEKFHYIHSVYPFTRELKIANIFNHTDIFNSMSVHYFPSTLPASEDTFWENRKKPEYDDSDVECIKNKLKNCTMSDE